MEHTSGNHRRTSSVSYTHLVHAPAFEGRTVVPVVQAECGAFLNNVNEQDGNAAADAQKDMISDETIFASEEEKKLQNDSQKEKDHDIGWTGCRRVALWERELGDLLGREIKVYDITQELRPALEAAWELSLIHIFCNSDLCGGDLSVVKDHH